MTIHVRAKSSGFYNGNRIRQNQLFDIQDMDHLGTWMELVKSKTDKSADAKKPDLKPVIGKQPKKK